MPEVAEIVIDLNQRLFAMTNSSASSNQWQPETSEKITIRQRFI
jgi:hypothetical protein